MDDHSSFELYPGKNFGSLCKDIVKNSEDKKNQLDVLITDLREMIKTPADAVMAIPLLREYYDVGVRNDEQLIKLAAIIQRLIAGKMDGEANGTMSLTDEERKQLMEMVDETAKVASEKPIKSEKPKVAKKDKTAPA